MGLLLFVLGIALGVSVNPWCFLLCAVPIVATLFSK